MYDGLVVTGTWLLFFFPYIGNVMIPTDALIFFRRVELKPPTRDIFSDGNDSNLEVSHFAGLAFSPDP